MPFYSHLHATDATPSKQQLLDTALLIAIVPHLFIVTPLMLLFLLSGLVGIIFIKESRSKHLLLFGLFGGLALALSFYDSLTFVGLSRLNIFVSLVISLLMVAVVLQRLSRQINFYLLFSPALFLALSYFFHNNILMLFYAVFALFSFLLLLLWHRMQSSFYAALKMSLSMFAFALPFIVLLFMIFPRISFETKDFGFKGQNTVRTGHDGLMHIGGDALLVPSKRVVMEVSFKESMPKESDLYFRGSALYHDNNDHWGPLQSNSSDTILSYTDSATTHYNVTLYPHHKRWIYQLDYPMDRPEESLLDSDRITTSKEPITDIFRYSARSQLGDSLHVKQLEAKKREAALHFDAKKDKRLFDLVKEQKLSDDPAKRLSELLTLFRSFELSYSLQPQGIDVSDPIDSFIFGSKKGYCVHFSSAFATMSRMAGIPSRIITGFKASYDNRIENYLVVKEEDAHAWVEVYLEGEGWQRIETTALAGALQNTAVQSEIRIQSEITSPFWHQINLNYMYIRYTLQNWILDYNRSKQIQLLQTLLSDMTAFLKLLGAFIVLIVLGYLLSNLKHHALLRHPALRALHPLLKQLEKRGLSRESGETIEAFLERAFKQTGDENLLHVKRLYNEIRYAKNAQERQLQSLKALSKKPIGT